MSSSGAAFFTPRERSITDGPAGSERCHREIRGNVDRNTGRIKDLEKKNDAVTKLAEAVAVMAEHMKTLDEKIDGMQTSVNN